MWTYLLVLASAVALAHGHGRVLDPPGRGTAWRSGFNARANYDDDGVNCGGFYRQHTVNGGKCGVCGDAYDEARPRAHERGGIYDSNVIVGSYEEGSVITITVEITANHLGFWEFKICPDAIEPDQDCFDAYPLELEQGGTKYYPNEGSTKYYVNYRLPKGLTCEDCILQWRYTCGNNWGNCKNGTQGLGCGGQETFGACSDISVVGKPDAPQFIEMDSLLLDKMEQLDFVRLLLNGAIMPQRWVQSNSIQPQKQISIPQKQTSIQPQSGGIVQAQKQRLNSKKPRSKGIFTEPHTKKSSKKNNRNRSKPRNHKRKKKSKTYAKWMSSWG